MADEGGVTGVIPESLLLVFVCVFECGWASRVLCRRVHRGEGVLEVCMSGRKVQVCVRVGEIIVLSCVGVGEVLCWCVWVWETM